MPNRDTYYPTRSVEDYKHKYDNDRVTFELDEKSVRLSASKWGRKHLIACRVIQQLGGKLLPILEGYAPKPEALEDQPEWHHIQPLIDGLSKDDLRNKSRRELEREHPYLGTVWSSLAKCLASQEPDESKEYATRNGQQTQMETQSSFEPHISHGREVDEDQRPKSSTPEHWSQQSYKSGSANGSELDEDIHCDSIKGETVTVNLAGAFISYVLNFCAVQDPATNWMIEFREEQIRISHDQAFMNIDATDDGGIWSVETNEHGKKPWKWGKRLAILEAKKAFEQIDIDNRAVVSDANWSQYTCEALTSFLQYPDQKEYVCPSLPI
jgi:hypothetical protein